MCIRDRCKNSVQVKIARTRDRPRLHMPFSITCREILKLVNDCIPIVFHWLKGIEIHYAFACEHCLQTENPDQQHFIRIPCTSTTYDELRCEKLQYVKLTARHQYWFEDSQSDEVRKRTIYS